MYRIRFHGRGGQGIKTASRILGTAFFREGFEVQDAPRYSAERRGAPIFAYVRAQRTPINERGVIINPDLVIVADDTLVAVPAAGVLQGMTTHTVLLIDSTESEDVWRRRLNVEGHVIVLPKTTDEPHLLGAACAGAAARLVGVIARASLESAIGDELSGMDPAVVRTNQRIATEAFVAVAEHAGLVAPATAAPTSPKAPDWIDLPTEPVGMSAPAIHGGLTSVQVRTGLWRSMRPVIDHDRCRRCWWVCSTFCPDSAILVDDAGRPQIDYDHCKGCMICVAQCPTHAIGAVREEAAA